MPLNANQDLFESCRTNQPTSALRHLCATPPADPNWRNPDLFNYSSLHISAICGHSQLVELLLSHPGILVNLQDFYGSTPFLLACMAGRTEIVKIFLQDFRIDVNLEDKWRVSPLWWASNNGHVDTVKWIIASGRALEGIESDGCQKGVKGQEGDPWSGRERNLLTAIEIAKGNGRFRLADLLSRFLRNPQKVQEELALEMGLRGALIGQLFALVVLHSDNYLQLIPPESSGFFRSMRFFDVAKQLPMELQMILCNRVYRSPKDLVLVKDSGPGFRSALRRASEPPLAEKGETGSPAMEGGERKKGLVAKIKDFWQRITWETNSNGSSDQGSNNGDVEEGNVARKHRKSSWVFRLLFLSLLVCLGFPPQ